MGTLREIRSQLPMTITASHPSRVQASAPPGLVRDCRVLMASLQTAEHGYAAFFDTLHAILIELGELPRPDAWDEHTHVHGVINAIARRSYTAETLLPAILDALTAFGWLDAGRCEATAAVFRRLAHWHHQASWQLAGADDESVTQPRQRAVSPPDFVDWNRLNLPLGILPGQRVPPSGIEFDEEPLEPDVPLPVRPGIAYGG